MYEDRSGGEGGNGRSLWQCFFQQVDLHGLMRHVAQTYEQHEGGCILYGERGGEGLREGGSHRFSHDFMTAEWSHTTEKSVEWGRGGLAAL